MSLVANQNDIVILNGTLLQNFDSIGVDKLDGRGGSPAPVYASEQRVQASGAWVTKAYNTPMVFSIGGWVSGYTPARRDHFLNQVNRAVSIDDCLLTFPFNDAYVTYTVRRTSELNVTFLNDNTALWSCTLTAFNPQGRLGGQPILYKGESSGFHPYSPHHRTYEGYVSGQSKYVPQKRKPFPNYDDGKNTYKPIHRGSNPNYDDGMNGYAPVDGADAPLYDAGLPSYIPPDVPDSPYDDGNNDYVPDYPEGTLLYDLVFPPGFFDGVDQPEDSGTIQKSTASDGGMPTDGMRFPIKFTLGTPSLRFSTGTSPGGIVTIHNPVQTGSLQFRISGACIAPSIHFQSSTGDSWTLSWDYLTMVDGDVLDVDVDSRTSVYNTTSVKPPSNREWPVAGPGDNVIYLTTEASSSNTKLTVFLEPTI